MKEGSHEGASESKKNVFFFPRNPRGNVQVDYWNDKTRLEKRRSGSL
jgi:hypothetical protein